MSEFGKGRRADGRPVGGARRSRSCPATPCCSALREKGVDAHPFDPAGARLCGTLKREGFDRAFIALHGRFGEDGTVQGALETLQHSVHRQRRDGVGAGDGQVAHQARLARERHSDAALSRGRRRTTDWMRVVAELGLPLIVKPAREGSTIGITKVATVDHDELARRVRRGREARRRSCSSRNSSPGTELTASILGGRALPLIRIEAPGGNYDYHNKYFSDETKYFCPCGLARREAKREIRAGVARGVRHRRLQRLGPARPDPARRRRVLVPRGQHVAGHDRPSAWCRWRRKQAGMSFADLCVEILRGAHVG